VLGSLPGADGLKTGHTDASGYGITISAKRDNQRLILVLNGLRYPQYHNDYFPNIKRAEEAGRVMDMAFREFRSYPLLSPNQVLGNVMVAGGNMPDVPVTASNALNVTMQVDSHAGMKTALRANPGLTAPIQVGQKVGVLVVSAPDFTGLTVPVYATQAVGKQGFLGAMFQSIQHLWKK
jgi:D-alanyl-D-alanine carboxypeptidase (penicillin-binding protein 5/6)